MGPSDFFRFPTGNPSFFSTQVRQALESLKLAKEAKEEADDALDDVETAGAGDFFAGTFCGTICNQTGWEMMGAWNS